MYIDVGVHGIYNDPCDTDHIADANYMDLIGREVRFKSINGGAFSGRIVDVVGEGFYIIRIQVYKVRFYYGIKFNLRVITDVLFKEGEFTFV